MLQNLAVVLTALCIWTGAGEGCAHSVRNHQGPNAPCSSQVAEHGKAGRTVRASSCSPCGAQAGQLGDGSQSQPRPQSRPGHGDKEGLRSNQKCGSGLGPAVVTWVRCSPAITRQVRADKAGPGSSHKVSSCVRTRIRPDGGNQHQTQPGDHQVSNMVSP